MYAAQLPIPVWWPAEARSAFIEEYASEAACMVLSEVDAIGDRMSDWAARLHVSDADESAMIASAQQVLLDEACSEVQYDLTEMIANRSARLTAEAVFDHGSASRAATRGVADGSSGPTLGRRADDARGVRSGAAWAAEHLQDRGAGRCGSVDHRPQHSFEGEIHCAALA